MLYRKEHLDKMRIKSVETCKKKAEERKNVYYLNPRLCLYCGKPIKYGSSKKQKFCSRSCSASYNNRKRSGNTSSQRRYCLFCGKEIVKKTSDSWKEYSKRKFCCTECRVDYNYSEYIKKWKKGTESGANPSGGIRETVRRYLFEKYNYSCAQCGWSKKNEYTGFIPLEVHHIDGNPNNNKEENLVLLCPCCHSLTKTFRGANTKYSNRSNYRKTYKERKLNYKRSEPSKPLSPAEAPMAGKTSVH